MKISLFESVSLLFLGTLVFFQFPQKTSGLPVNFGQLPRIVGGVSTTRGQWPYYVTIAVARDDSGHDFYLCGGTLINPLWVLTSSDCVREIDLMVLLLGVYNITESTAPDVTDLLIDTIVVHPCRGSSQEPYRGNNLALIKLAEPVQNVTTACMPVSYQSDWDDLQTGGNLRECIAIGFGITDTGRGAEILQQVSFSNTSRQLCRDAYEDYASDTKICASGNHGEDACGGDNGGPILCRSNIDRCDRFYIAGVTVGGSNNCGNENTPGIYEAIFPNVQWIEGVLREDPTVTNNTVYACIINSGGQDPKVMGEDNQSQSNGTTSTTEN